MTRTMLFTAAAIFALASCTAPEPPDVAQEIAPAEGDRSDRSQVEGSISPEAVFEPGPSPDAPSVPPALESARVRSAPAPAARAMEAPLKLSMRPPTSFRLPSTADVDRERYPDGDPHPVKLVSEAPISTFSVDVDTASYAVARRFLHDGTMPPSDAVRVEELVNYFDYDYPLPDDRDAPFFISTTVLPTPWNADTQLIHIGLKGYDIVPEQAPRANLVFLLDVSGSMSTPDKLPLLKQSVRLLIEQLDENDTVSIVVYAGAAGAVLEPTPGSDRGRILAALEGLSAGGSTAGGEGLRLAYALAERNFDERAINRIILATDGDFNVGVTSDERLEDFVERKRETGIYLSVLGFGRGNYNDALMQTIAQAGNGTAAYIDSLQEARKVLHDEMTGVLFPIANDVKIQVEFNPRHVAEYRLIGYETRMLRREDFSNDAVDAGEIGAGHEVTAIYEVAAPDSAGRLIEDSRYDPETVVGASNFDDEIAFLRIRYKLPGEDESLLIERPISDRDAVTDVSAAPRETRFAIAVAAFGQLLRGEPYLRDFGYDAVLLLAQGARGEDLFGYRAEFVQLVRLAKSAAALPALESGGARWPR